MRIVKLTAANVKRLKTVEITPEGNIVEVRGKNGAGKSSVLDAIWYALGGKSASPAKPIRDGELEASSMVEFDDLVVRRTWNASGSRLAVTKANGVPVSSPQAVLDKLVGALTFDPLEFTRMAPAAQRETLLALLGIGDRLTALDEQEQAAYAQRREAKRRAEEAEAAAHSIEVPSGTPDECLDIGELTAGLDAALQAVRENEGKRRAVARNTEQLNEFRARYERLTAELEQAKERLLQCEKSWLNLEQTLEAEQAELGQLKDPDTDAIRQRLGEAGQINQAVATKQRRSEYQHEVANWRQKAQAANAQVEAARKTRVELLRGAKWPIDGLGFADDVVTFDGVPFAQCAASERLRTSLAIAMAANPTLRVLLVRDGSLLDDDSLAAIYEHVRDNDYQLWIERVGEDGQAAVVIEDGHVRQ